MRVRLLFRWCRLLPGARPDTAAVRLRPRVINDDVVARSGIVPNSITPAAAGDAGGAAAPNPVTTDPALTGAPRAVPPTETQIPKSSGVADSPSTSSPGGGTEPGAAENQAPKGAAPGADQTALAEDEAELAQMQSNGVKPAVLRSVRRPENVERAIAKAKAEAEKRRQEEKNARSAQPAPSQVDKLTLQAYLTAAPAPPAIPVQNNSPDIQFSIGPRTINAQAGTNVRFSIDIASSTQVSLGTMAIRFNRERLKVVGVLPGEILKVPVPIAFSVEDDILVVTFNPKPVSIPRGKGSILTIDFMTQEPGQSEISIISNRTRILNEKNDNLKWRSTGSRISVIKQQ